MGRDCDFWVGLAGPADGAGDDVFVGIGSLALFGELAGGQPFGEERVILRQELKSLFAEAVDAAVADVRIDDGVVGPEKAAEGGSHAMKFFRFGSEMMDAPVCFFDRVAHLDHQFQNIAAFDLFRRAAEKFDGLFCGDFAGLMPSHPIGEGEKSNLWKSDPDILIIRASHSNVR